MFQVLTAQQLRGLGMSRRQLAEAKRCCLRLVRKGHYVIRKSCDDSHHGPIRGLSTDHDTSFPKAFGDLRDEAEELRVQIACRLGELLPGDVFSHVSAALIHCLDPAVLESSKVEISRNSPTRNYDGVFIYSRRLPPEQVSSEFAYPVTTLPRTLADVALDRSLEVSVPLISQALRSGEVDRADITDLLAKGQRGRRRALLAVDLSSAEYESPAEAVCAVKFHRFGVTGMVPQVDTFTESGKFIGRNDFRHKSAAVAVEVHGLGKFYLNPHGPDEAAKLSHQRNMDLLNAGFKVFNLSFGDLFRPRIFAAIKRAIETTDQRKTG